ncbi:hypothetical protein Sru01_05170 [Sphaerisporangium rufum]|uniref:Tetratricopeptide repeat protein n=1 Tax=Sphaerisporangium rufum TaxID=1381558 RepID=A0A919QZ85_9ACTN|nr:tetratricopeptide repeat protein [Sphaerisporangium rufum]GII75535.1 hypothetical protein Sru01_05170 [Sphaerisporangium rufum]
MSTGDLLARADRLAALDLREEAAELYERLIGEGVPGAAVRYGAMLAEAGDHPAAEPVLRTALAAGDTDAYHWLCDVLIATGRVPEAGRLMEEAAGRGLPGAALRAAAIWADLAEDRTRAEQWYRTAIDRGDQGALNDYGAFLSEDPGREAEARRVLRQAAEQGDALAFSNLGAIELDRGEPEAALGWLRQSLAGGGSSESTALLKIADAEERLGNLDAARRYHDRAVNARIPGAHAGRARFLAYHGTAEDLETAERDFRTAVRNGEEGADYYYATFLAAQDRVDEAIDHYRRAIDAGSDGAYEELALILQARGETEAAEECFTASIAAGWLSAVLSYAEFLRDQGRGAEVPALEPRARELGATPEQLAALRGAAPVTPGQDAPEAP